MQRLGWADRIAEILDPSVMLPQVAQGALAVECRADDEEALERLAGIEDPVARRCVDAERAFLARLGGGCDLPVGALATDLGDGRLRLGGLLANPAPRRSTAEGDSPAALGLEVAEALLTPALRSPAASGPSLAAGGPPGPGSLLAAEDQ